MLPPVASFDLNRRAKSSTKWSAVLQFCALREKRMDFRNLCTNYPMKFNEQPCKRVIFQSLKNWQIAEAQTTCSMYIFEHVKVMTWGWAGMETSTSNYQHRNMVGFLEIQLYPGKIYGEPPIHRKFHGVTMTFFATEFRNNWVYDRSVCICGCKPFSSFLPKRGWSGQKSTRIPAQTTGRRHGGVLNTAPYRRDLASPVIFALLDPLRCENYMRDKCLVIVSFSHSRSRCTKQVSINFGYSSALSTSPKTWHSINSSYVREWMNESGQQKSY